MADEVLCEAADGVVTITINRPDKRNALNGAVLRGLTEHFTRLESDPGTRVIVVRGAGRAFCSGMDLDEMKAQQAQAADPESGAVKICQQIERSRHPTIAVVQGDAYAGGCELALHCDLRVAADVARFCMPLARLGLVVPFPLGQKLVEVVGPAFTRQILLTGQPVPARRALEMGMVHQVVPLAELDGVATATARAVADNAPLSLSGMKQVILRATSARGQIAHEDLDELARRARKTADAREGVRAMLEKRRPQFRGE
jgi:enoyl-CoA hydratase/carnithine racemase